MPAFGADLNFRLDPCVLGDVPKKKTRIAHNLRDVLDQRRGPNQVSWLAQRLGVRPQTLHRTLVDEVVVTNTVTGVAWALGGKAEFRIVFADEVWIVTQFRDRARKKRARKAKVHVVDHDLQRDEGVDRDLQGRPGVDRDLHPRALPPVRRA